MLVSCPLLLVLVCLPAAAPAARDHSYRQDGWTVLDWTQQFHARAPRSDAGAAGAADHGVKGRERPLKHELGQSATKNIRQAQRLEANLQQVGSLSIPPASDGKGQIAFLFLARAGLPLQDVWTKYFQSCPEGSYQVLIHQQEGAPTSLGQSLKPGEVVQGDLRMSYEMNKAMWQLLSEASKNPETSWFHFLSDTDLPIRSCSELHSMLDGAKGSSFVGDMAITDQAYMRKYSRCFNGISFASECTKSSQWVTLFRPHALSLLSQWVPKDASYWSATKVTDEHLIATTFRQNNVPVTGHVLTYTKWPRSNWPEPPQWSDMPPQDNCALEDGHPCPITIADPHIQNPSRMTFFARKFSPADLQNHPQEYAALLSRIGPQ